MSSARHLKVCADKHFIEKKSDTDIFYIFLMAFSSVIFNIFCYSSSQSFKFFQCKIFPEIRYTLFNHFYPFDDRWFSFTFPWKRFPKILVQPLSSYAGSFLLVTNTRRFFGVNHLLRLKFWILKTSGFSRTF